MAEAKKQNFLHGAAILTAGVVVMKILGAIYKIPLNNILGDTGYGYFNLAYNIYNVLLTISTAGLPVALSRMVAEAETLRRPNQVRRIFRVATVTLGAVGLLFSLAMLLFPTEMAIFFASKAEVSRCVFAISPAVLLVCLTSAFRGYIQGHGNMTPTTVGQVVEVMVKVAVGLALAIYMTRAGKSLPVSSAGAIFGVTAGSLAALIYMFVSYLRRYHKKSREDCAASSDVPTAVGSTLGVFIKIGVAITLGASVMSVITLVDAKLIQIQLPRVRGIGQELSDILYGSYSAMQTLFNLPAAFITPMTIAVVPAISEAVAKRAHGEASAIAESGMRISAVVAVPMGIGLAVLSRPIVKILYPRTHEMGPTILAFMGFASFFVCMSLVTNAILQAHGNERKPVISMIAGGATKITCNLLLVRRPELNILGACIGTIACYAVICLLNCIFISRALEKPPRYGRVFLRPLASGAVMGGAAWAVYGLAARLLGAADGSRLLTLIAMCAAIAVAVVVYLVMVIVSRSVTMEDMKLIPKGEKIAKILHIH